MKKILLTTAAAAIFGLSPLSAKLSVIYDGGSINVDVTQSNAGTYATDNDVGNPAGSLNFTSTGVGDAVTFASTDSSFFVTPNEVDFSASTVVSFDYLIPDGSSNNVLSDFRLKLVNPANRNINTTAVDLSDSISLIADGNWQTASFSASGWGGTMTNLFNANTIDPSVPQQFFIQVKAGDPGLDLKIDNIKISILGDEEPVTFWADSPADESGWRNSGSGYDEPGIGWIWDSLWPWVFTTGIEGEGQWISVYALSGDRNGFYAYVVDGGYWIYGVSTWGYYYSFENGNEGWVAFAL